jgi:hypothetical protein
MFVTIIFFVSVLIAINFLLLKFSSNSIAKSKKAEKPFVLRERTTIISTQLNSNQLAATGS